MMMRGFDACDNTGKIDFAEAKRNGYEFAVFRCICAKDRHVDQRFYNYVDAAIAAGLHVGAYCFVYIDGTARDAEIFAEKCLEALKPLRGKLDLPVYIDWEYDTDNNIPFTLSKNERTELLRSICDHIEKNGWYTGVYLNPDYLYHKIDDNIIEIYTLWLAQWGTAEAAFPCTLRQTAGDVSVPWAQGKIDLNTLHFPLPSTIRRLGFNGFPLDKEIAEATATIREPIRRGTDWELIDSGDGWIIKLKKENGT